MHAYGDARAAAAVQAERERCAKPADQTAEALLLAREVIEQLIACHDEATCPALAVANEAIAKIDALTGVKLQSALSRIDYVLGEPNEMQVSSYDVHFDEDRVVARVATVIADLRAQLEAAQAALREARDALSTVGARAASEITRRRPGHLWPFEVFRDGLTFDIGYTRAGSGLRAEWLLEPEPENQWLLQTPDCRRSHRIGRRLTWQKALHDALMWIEADLVEQERAS